MKTFIDPDLAEIICVFGIALVILLLLLAITHKPKITTVTYDYHLFIQQTGQPLLHHPSCPCNK